LVRKTDRSLEANCNGAFVQCGWYWFRHWQHTNVSVVVCRHRRALKAFNMSLIMPGVTADSFQSALSSVPLRRCSLCAFHYFLYTFLTSQSYMYQRPLVSPLSA